MEDSAIQADPLAGLIVTVFVSFIFGLIAHMLAKEKGRNVTLWTILGFIPAVNIFCIWFFAGATNLWLEEKIDRLLNSPGKQ